MDPSPAMDTLESDGASFCEMHGRRGSLAWDAPVRTLTFDCNARSTFTEIIAHEYRDTPSTLAAKVAALAGLVRQAQQCVAYTGAGISTSSGIHDYASKGDGAGTAAKKEVKDWRDAQPTRAHRVMVALHRAGMLPHWINQNHDSLPQKAGFPQHALNEIHGSLHDPANPIVPYQGSLRDDLFAWMHQWQRSADLCLALGTSLSGFNADQVVETAMAKFDRGEGLGAVFVNLQRTELDAGCTLRIFAELDVVMDMLAQELGLDVPSPADAPGQLEEPEAPEAAAAAQEAPEAAAIPTSPASAAAHDPTMTGEVLGDDRFRLRGFDPSTGRPAADPQQEMVWDLRVGQHVRLTGGPYNNDVGRVVDKSPDGHYKLRFEHSVDDTFNTRRRPFALWLGRWWVDEALRGRGIVPGGPVPVVPADAPAEPTEDQAAKGAPEAVARAAVLAKVGLPPPAVRAKLWVEGFAPGVIDQALPLST